MRHVALLIAAATVVAESMPAQRPSDPSPPGARGSVVRVDSLGPIWRDSLVRFASPLEGRIEVRGSVSLYRVVYRTVLRGRATEASGLLVVPHARRQLRGVVMFLHGTNVTRALAPSQPDRVDGNEEAAVFGGNGYLTVLPDYLGLGVSSVPQPYMIAAAQSDAAIDLLRAVRDLAAPLGLAWNPSLMLLGFSQGGHSVAAVQRQLERQPVPGYRLRGAMAVAGAFALRDVTLPYALQHNGVGYLAITVSAYAQYYGHSFAEVFAAPFALSLPALLDGSKGMDDIGPALPADARTLFTPDFAAQLDGRTAGWFSRALDENSVHRWIPRAPLRLYYGEDDVIVSPSDAKRLHAYASRRGGRVSLFSLGAVGHQESSARMFAPALRWFDSLTVRRGAP